MTVTDRLKIIDNKIKANRTQYDLGREAAKISALSSKDLFEKYEYLTCEDLGHRPSALEKTKFEYSPLGNVFTKGLYEEGPLKRLKNIEDKNEELPGKNTSYESDFYCDPTYNCHKFYRDFGNFKKMTSLGSKRGELINRFFHTLETSRILGPLMMMKKT